MRAEKVIGHSFFETLYIDWSKDADHEILLTKEEWNVKIKEVKATRKKTKYKTIGNFFLRGNYFIEERRGYVCLYIYENKRWCIYKARDAACKPNTKIDTKDVAIQWSSKFRELNGMSENKAFGMVKGITCRKFIPSACVFATDNMLIRNTKLKNVHKADIKSAYAWAMSKPLPDTKSRIIKPGHVEPTEEYPFAFYPDSGHSAVYNEYDTRNFNSRFYPQYAYENVPHEETWLFKASEYSYKSTVDYFFKLKEESDGEDRQRYKNYLVVPTGMMRPKIHDSKGNLLPNADKIYGLYLQAAVILGRVVNRVITIAENLTAERNIVLSIATDSIIWIGKDSDYAVSTNNLGDFHKEFTNAEMVIKTTNNYLIKDDTGVYQYKHMGRIDRKHNNFDEYIADEEENKEIIELLQYNRTSNLFEINKKVWEN